VGVEAPPTLQTQKIPVTGSAYRGVDDDVLSDRSGFLQDAFVDDGGYTYKRPGLQQLLDLGTGHPVDGVFWWESESAVLAVSNGHIFKITANGTVTADLGKYLLDKYEIGYKSRPSFAEAITTNVALPYKDYVVIANGGAMALVGDDGTVKNLSGVSMPTAVDSVGYIDLTILAGQAGTADWYYSDVNTPETWTYPNRLTAESKPDHVGGLFVGRREIAIVGTESIEIWAPIEASPWYARIEGAFTERGVYAPQTMKMYNETWFWLDNARKFCMMNGRTAIPFSTPFDKYLQTLTTFSDAFADVMEISGRTFYIVSFPAENKTIVMDVTAAPQQIDWSEWGYWNPKTASWDRFLGNCYTYAKGWGMHLWGSRLDSKVYRMSHSYYDDAGREIVVARRTGWVDHGSFVKKRAATLRIKTKRGATTQSTDPKMMVRWRNDGGPWTMEKDLPIGKIGDTVHIAVMSRVGIYRTRQYEFRFSASEPFTLIDAETDVEMLTR